VLGKGDNSVARLNRRGRKKREDWYLSCPRGVRGKIFGGGGDHLGFSQGDRDLRRPRKDSRSCADHFQRGGILPSKKGPFSERKYQVRKNQWENCMIGGKKGRAASPNRWKRRAAIQVVRSQPLGVPLQKKSKLSHRQGGPRIRMAMRLGMDWGFQNSHSLNASLKNRHKKKLGR